MFTFSLFLCPFSRPKLFALFIISAHHFSTLSPSLLMLISPHPYLIDSIFCSFHPMFFAIIFLINYITILTIYSLPIIIITFFRYNLFLVVMFYFYYYYSLLLLFSLLSHILLSLSRFFVDTRFFNVHTHRHLPWHSRKCNKLNVKQNLYKSLSPCSLSPSHIVPHITILLYIFHITNKVYLIINCYYEFKYLNYI